MSESPATGRFPAALRSAARARWSHRDPVEEGNPFPEGDVRREVWDAATRVAQDALVRLDRELDAAERVPRHLDQREPYRDRVIALAVSRFDVWAGRLQSVVGDRAAAEDYEAWLTTYVTNWIAYVADTCPNVAVGDELRRQLSARAQHWITEATRAR